MNFSEAHRDDPPPSRTPQPSWILRGAVALVLLGLGLAGFFLLSREPAKPKPQPGKPPPVRTRVTELRRRDFPVSVRSQGIVRAREEVTLSAQISSRVARITPKFEDGAFFQAGEVLLELEADDFRTAVAIAEARVLSTEAAARLAEFNQRRDTELSRDQLIPTAQAEATVAALAQAKADAATAVAQLERARRDLERTHVRAPFAGCVRRRAVGPGQWVTVGAPLGSVFSIDAVEVRLPVSGPALAFLDLPGEHSFGADAPRSAAHPESPSIGNAIEPRFEVHLQDSLTSTQSFRWRGHIVRGEQALHDETLERFIIVRVDDPFGLSHNHPPLRPGQPVVGFISGRILTNVLVLPRVAVRELDRIELVDPKTLLLSSRRITPLWADEQNIVVRDPSIPDGALVATTHLVYAPEGATVEIIPDASTNSVAFPSAIARGTNTNTAPTNKP